MSVMNRKGGGVCVNMMIYAFLTVETRDDVRLLLSENAAAVTTTTLPLGPLDVTGPHGCAE